MRVFGGLFAGIAALVGVLAAGWYIAISQYPAYAGAACGMIYGAILLPRFSGPPRITPMGRKKWTAIAVTTLACGAIIVYPLLPKQSEQSLEVLYVRLVPGPEDLTATVRTAGLTQEELKLLNPCNLCRTKRCMENVSSRSSNDPEEDQVLALAGRF
jgi:hypothetical protein